MTEYTNLSEAFLSAAENTNVGIRFFKGKDNEYRETYAEILQKAQRCLCVLQKRGLKKGNNRQCIPGWLQPGMLLNKKTKQIDFLFETT